MKINKDYTYCMKCVGRGHYGFINDTSELNVCLFCNAIGLVHSEDGTPLVGVGPDCSKYPKIQLWNSLGLISKNKRE